MNPIKFLNTKLQKKFGKAYIKNLALNETRSVDLLKMVPDKSLVHFFSNVHSQIGQDGILAEIFKRLKINKGLFCEFGAWNGVYLSNCRKLFEEGWNGIFIEANKKKFKALENEYRDFSNIKCIKEFVGAPKYGIEGNRLIDIFNKHKLKKKELDFLSIDIDGPDLEVFEEIGMKPKVVLLEGGMNYDFTIEGRASDAIRDIYHHPLKEIIKSVLEKGYIVVCSLHDCYLVRKDLAEVFPTFSTEELLDHGYNGAPLWLRKKIMLARKDYRLQIESDRLLSYLQ
tara:strand:- start:586 stop:1437 length:852 start_codon:yes stop_codon:yes gene_type:complete